jgi:hypothetical protein
MNLDNSFRISRGLFSSLASRPGSIRFQADRQPKYPKIIPLPSNPMLYSDRALRQPIS